MHKKRLITMNKNKYIKVIQEDLLEKKKSVIFKGEAAFEIDDDHRIKYKENKEASVLIHLNESEGFLERLTDTTTKINFDVHKKSEALLLTQYGEMRMDVITDEITLNNNNLVLAYTLLQEKNIIGKFKMKVEWNHEQD